MNGDLISRQAAIEMFHRVANIGWNHGIETTVADAFKEAAEMVENLPDAEPSVVTMKLEMDKDWLKKAMEEAELTLVAEPRKGKWEEKQDNDWAGGGAWVCSECGYGYAFGAYHEADEFNYCPNCGARMKESE